MTTLKPVEETVKEIPTDYETMVGSISNQRYYRQMTVINALTQDRHHISNALVEALEEQKYTADQGIDAEMGSHNEALTKAQNIIKELLKSKN